MTSDATTLVYASAGLPGTGVCLIVVTASTHGNGMQELATLTPPALIVDNVQFAPETAAILEQENERFQPRILPIVAGQTVSFPNRDRFYHNVFSVSSIEPFDLGQMVLAKDPPVHPCLTE